MNKRYQVFVSSTFRDLTEERQAVIQALLEMDAIPAGMELFPAANTDAWGLIEQVISESDYYILIIGGKYGSSDEDGVSYTEREYDHAVSSNIPVLPFLHEKPDDIPSGKTDSKEAAQEKLQAFREKVENAHHCKYWNDSEQLGSRVSRALMLAIKNTQRTGWVRADQAGGPEALVELNRLRLKIDELNEELRKNREEPPKGSEEFLHGDDDVPLDVTFQAYDDENLKLSMNEEYFISRDATKSEFTLSLGLTWDEVFSIVGPLMLHETIERTLKKVIEEKAHKSHWQSDGWYREHQAQSYCQILWMTP